MQIKFQFLYTFLVEKASYAKFLSKKEFKSLQVQCPYDKVKLIV